MEKTVPVWQNSSVHARFETFPRMGRKKEKGDREGGRETSVINL